MSQTTLLLSASLRRTLQRSAILLNTIEEHPENETADEEEFSNYLIFKSSNYEHRNNKCTRY
jgi:hypothetical protein